jgi:hypothetical protein
MNKTKFCFKCRKSKSIKKFNKNRSRKDGLQSKCRDCDQKRARKYFRLTRVRQLPKIKARQARIRAEVREKLLVYLIDHPCVDCGNTDPRVLEFDHVRGKKVMSISDLIRYGRSWEVIFVEIKKCQVRCANCHKIRTYRKTWRGKVLILRVAHLVERKSEKLEKRVQISS